MGFRINTGIKIIIPKYKEDTNVKKKDIIFISKNGSITIPSHIRKQFKYEKGQQFIISLEENGEIVLKPAISIPINTKES